jgi:uncharacterized damage-inducible protein DinB
MAQDQELPYAEIPQYYNEYNAGTVLARLIDGLGSRYYWASNLLKQEDLDYLPSEDGMSTIVTLEHIYNLSTSILVTLKGLPIEQKNENDYSYEQLRSKTLFQLKEAALLVSQMDDSEITNLNVVFKRGGKMNTFPLWNLINGIISDAIYHTGQIVSFRRTTGNPIDFGINLFTGKNRN